MLTVKLFNLLVLITLSVLGICVYSFVNGEYLFTCFLLVCVILLEVHILKLDTLSDNLKDICDESSVFEKEIKKKS